MLVRHSARLAPVLFPLATSTVPRLLESFVRCRILSDEIVGIRTFSIPHAPIVIKQLVPTTLCNVQIVSETNYEALRCRLNALLALL